MLAVALKTNALLFIFNNCGAVIVSVAMCDQDFPVSELRGHEEPYH